MEAKIEQTQKLLTSHFSKLIKENMLAHAYLLSGPAGTGKTALALWIAQAVFCRNPQDSRPCQQCDECLRIKDGNHPDVVVVEPEGMSIKVDQIRYLKSEFSKSGVESRQKIFIIKGAHKMTMSAANSLLKFLEEPAGQVTAFLLTDEPNKLLPTIISRCQLFELSELTKNQLVAQLVEKGFSTKISNVLAVLTSSVNEATAISEKENFEKLLSVLESWSNKVIAKDDIAFVFIQSRLLPLVKTKEEQELVVKLVILLMRDLMLVKFDEQNEVIFNTNLKLYQEKMLIFTTRQVVDALELCLGIPKKVERNISFQNVMETTTLRLLDIFS